MKNFVLYLSLFALLAGCGEKIPATFRAVGLHENQSYKIEVKIGRLDTAPAIAVFLNDEQALYVERPMSSRSDPNCKYKSGYIWTCRFADTYKGMKLVVVEESHAVPFALFYDVYLDGQLVQRVTGTL